MKAKVYVALSADILHEGHINILKKASKLGKVIVGLLTDNAINEYNQLNYSPYTYLNGWSEVLSNIIDSSENIIQNNLDKIDIMENVKDLSENYFIKGKYNEINLFTRDLLIHLTQKVICSTIEIIIRKVLLAQLQDQEN